MLLLLWSIGLFNFFLDQKTNSSAKDLPIILPYNAKVKVEPPEEELFPHSESPIWKTYKNLDKESKIIETEPKNKIEKNKNISNKKENINNFDKNSQALSVLKTDIKNKGIENKNDIKVNDNGLKNQTITEKSNTENSETKAQPDDATELKKERTILKSDVYAIQLASLSNEKLLENEWLRLKKKYTPKLNKFKYTSKKIKLNNKVFHRLLVGSFKSKVEASKFCKEIDIQSNCLIRFIK